ncbi:MAG: hypothetical protein PVG56_03150, partial [Anaerolineae bacterium]
MTLSLDEQRIAEIVQKVVADLQSPGVQPGGQAPEATSLSPGAMSAGFASGQEGVYREIDDA